MSALEQALRQIEKDRQARKGETGLRGVMPGIMLDSRGQAKEPRRGLTIAVVILSLACAGTWLIMLGVLPFGTQDLSRWGQSILSLSSVFSPTKKVAPLAPAGSETASPVTTPETAPSSAPASVQPRNGTPSLPITVASPSVNPAPASPAVPNATAPNTVPPNASPVKPVTPQSTPAPMATQPVSPLKPATPPPVAAPAPAAKPALVAPIAATPATTPVAPAVNGPPKPPVVAVAPPAAPSKPAVPAAAPSANAAEDEPDPVRKPVTSSKSDAEPPQLSRTDTDRLSTTGQASAAAKAIDVDYQMIERSLARGDHQVALESAGKLEKYIGDNWRTRYLTGVALMGLNRWDQAIVALSKAQDLNPTHAMSALYLSVALQERGEHIRAIQVLDKALISLPNSPELWLNLGHSHDALGHKADAKTAYNRFMELSVNRQDLAGQRVWVLNRVQKDK